MIEKSFKLKSEEYKTLFITEKGIIFTSKHLESTHHINQIEKYPKIFNTSTIFEKKDIDYIEIYKNMVKIKGHSLNKGKKLIVECNLKYEDITLFCNTIKSIKFYKDLKLSNKTPIKHNRNLGFTLLISGFTFYYLSINIISDALKNFIAFDFIVLSFIVFYNNYKFDREKYCVYCNKD